MTVHVWTFSATMLLLGCSAGPIGDRELQAGEVATGGSCELPDANVALQGPEAAARLLEALAVLGSCHGAEATSAEAALLELVESLNDAGLLRPTLRILAADAIELGVIPPISPDRAVEYVDQLADMIDAELCAHGRAWDCEGTAYEDWETMATRHLRLARASSVSPEGPGAPSHLTNEAFVAELEALSGSRFVSGSSVEPLIDGPASFALRDRLLADARSSIFLMTWAIYDDETGRATTDALIRRFREGIDVRVIVDEQVSYRTGHGPENVARLEQAGVPVVRFRDPVRRYDGTHRKLLVVDGEVAIAGGMNIGDMYAHRGPASAGRWRDTDVVVRGPAVTEAALLFAEVWNEQTMLRPEYRELPPLDQPAGTLRSEGVARVAVTNHTPGRDAHVTLATLKAIEGATTSVDIENSYLVLTPDVRDALAAARRRGVRVRVLTNSAQSLGSDVVMIAPILGSIPPLLEAGVEVWVKQGETLHGKLMIVDGVYAWVGSYNLHPRSVRHEGEMAVQVLDPGLAGALGEVFEGDLAAARPVQSPDQERAPTSPITLLTGRYFFDQL